jgi:hypothetical protein
MRVGELEIWPEDYNWFFPLVEEIEYDPDDRKLATKVSIVINSKTGEYRVHRK